MASELFHQLALTLVPQVGDVQAKILVEHFGAASAIFKARKETLEKVEGIGSIRAAAVKNFSDYEAVEKELKFIEKYKIQTLFINDKAYPKRLLHCYDPPTLLFYKGTADLNALRMIAIVGTRSNTEYGKMFTEKLVADLAEWKVTVVSGLAYGIDAYAHKAALKESLPTIGVVGHGLDTLYPPGHNALAREMIKCGGILSEFFSGTEADKFNFPQRNRIVAGLTDATVVVETLVDGGSMITAKMADAYNRDVFAVPGRTTDTKSSGTNYLIQNNKAILLTSAAEMAQVMGWEEKSKGQSQKQKALFIELTEEEKKIVALLQEKDTTGIDEVNLRSGLSNSAVAAALLNLELNHLVASLPGKQYRLT